MDVYRQLQVKMPKSKNHNISKTTNQIKSKFEDVAETNNYTSWVVSSYHNKPLINLLLQFLQGQTVFTRLEVKSHQTT